MAQKPNYTAAASHDIEAALCQRLKAIRLHGNISQSQLASEAGVSRRTVTRMENGEGVSLDTFIRLMRALGLLSHLENLLPDPRIRPMERVHFKGRERQRARPKKRQEAGEWSWQPRDDEQ